MKLATFRNPLKQSRIAIVHGADDRLFDLAAAAERAGRAGAPFASMADLIDAGGKGLDVAAEIFAARGNEDDLSHPLSDVVLLAPLPEPRQFRDAMSFPKHILQGPRGMQAHLALKGGNPAEAERIMATPLGELPDVYRQVPIFYITNRFSVRGTGSTVRWPRYSRLMDYELELAIVTTGTACNVSEREAGKHIFGYTIFNDFSARDRQMVEMQGRLGPSKGKSFDGGNVLGPWIVTKDEIPDPHSLRMQARVNGQTRCDSTSSGMLYSFEELVARIAEDETIRPAEVIGSGTVGDGCGLEHGRFLDHGDEVELEIERIGVLRNRVERQDAAALAAE